MIKWYILATFFFGLFILFVRVDGAVHNDVLPRITEKRIVNMTTKIVFLGDRHEYAWFYHPLEEFIQMKSKEIVIYEDDIFRLQYGVEWINITEHLMYQIHPIIQLAMNKDDCFDTSLLDKLFTNLIQSMNWKLSPLIIMWAPSLTDHSGVDLYYDMPRIYSLPKEPHAPLRFTKLEEWINKMVMWNEIEKDHVSYSDIVLNGERIIREEHQKHDYTSEQDGDRKTLVEFIGISHPYVMLNLRSLYQEQMSVLSHKVQQNLEQPPETLKQNLSLYDNELNVNATALSLRKEVRRYYLAKYCTRYNYTRFCDQLLGKDITYLRPAIEDENHKIQQLEQLTMKTQALTIEFCLKYVENYLNLASSWSIDRSKEVAVFVTNVVVRFYVILDGNLWIEEISSYSYH
jgi:hypothetical protein